MDLTLIIDKLANLSEYAAEEIKQAMEALNSEAGMNDPSQSIRTQFMLNKYSTFTNYESSMVKMIRDLIGGIISKL